MTREHPSAALEPLVTRGYSRARLLAITAFVIVAVSTGLAHLLTARAMASIRERLGEGVAADLARAERLSLTVDFLGVAFLAVAFVLLMREVRAHARAERVAAANSALLQAILNSMSEGVTVVDQEGRIILMNEARRSAHPPGLDYVPREKWVAAFRFLHPDDRTPLERDDLPMSRALRGEEGSAEFIRQELDGSGEVYEHVTFRPLRVERQTEPAGAVVVVRDETARRKNDLALRESLSSLQKALADVKTLRGILPICANCKKIRDDAGAWTQVEAYVRDHTDAEFSHGICPDCTRSLYPDLAVTDVA